MTLDQYLHGWERSLPKLPRILADQTLDDVLLQEYQDQLEWMFDNRDTAEAMAVNEGREEEYKNRMAAVMTGLEPLREDLKNVLGVTWDTCTVAFDNTQGTYYCSREQGHTGPCAAHPKA